MKRKKGKMEWDEMRDQWAPSYGYDRVNDDGADDPIIEVKANADLSIDPRQARYTHTPRARVVARGSALLRSEAC